MTPDDRHTGVSTSNHKTRDRAALLPIIGLLLLIPPIADVFQLDARIGGIPVTALYLFAVWGLLIAGAALLSRKLRSADSGDEPDSRESAD